LPGIFRYFTKKNMLVGNALGWFIIIFISILVTVALAWLMFAKLKVDPKFTYLVLAAGLICGCLIYKNTLCVIEVITPSRFEQYMVFGSARYIATDGQQVTIAYSDGDDTFIINATDHLMAIESIAYGDPVFIFDAGPTLIDAHTAMAWCCIPDYFPNETPPGTVSVTKGIDSETKHWLRFGY
jgi:hypothetical protein